MTTSAAAETKSQKMHPLPDVGDILFLFVALIPLMLKPNYVFGDGSTGWHLITGEYVLNHLSVPTHDPFSYLAASPDPNNPQKLWVAYEWLSDAIMALLVRLGGLNLLAVCVSCAIGLLFLMLYERCRKEGTHFLFVVYLCIVGALVSAVHWLARPHLFTFFGVLIFSSTLEDFYRRSISAKRMIITLALYTLLWVNCHPAFVMGFILIAIYLFSALVSAAYFTPGAKRAGYLETAKMLSFAFAATLVASFVNPYGIKLYEYIAHYLKGSSILAATDEFLSPVFHMSLQPTCLEILFALFIIGLALSQKRLSLPRLLCCLAFSHLALSGVRNMPLFTIIILPAISQLFSKLRLPGEYRAPRLAAAAPAQLVAESIDRDSQPAKWWQIVVNFWHRIGAMIDDEEWRCKMHLLPIVMFIGLAAVSCHPLDGKVFGAEIVASGWDPENKPTETLEYLRKAEQAGTLQANKGFNYDNWGGYINYRLGTPIFINDRADYYGEQFYARYSIINQVIPRVGKGSGWLDWLKFYDIQWALIPKDSRLAQALKDTAGWKLAAEDKASALLVRPDKPPAPVEINEQH